jgi:hypothetical protein
MVLNAFAATIGGKIFTFGVIWLDRLYRLEYIALLEDILSWSALQWFEAALVAAVTGSIALLAWRWTRQAERPKKRKSVLHGPRIIFPVQPRTNHTSPHHQISLREEEMGRFTRSATLPPQRRPPWAG